MPTKTITVALEDEPAPTPAEASRIALAEARQKAARLRAAADDLEAEHANLMTRLRGGDATVTAEQLTACNDDARLRAQMLADAAKGEEERAERALINDNFELAGLVATALSDLLPSVLIEIIPRPVNESEGDPTPQLTIIQRKPARVIGGALEGQLQLRYRRGALYAPLYAADVAAALAGHEIEASVDPGSSSSTGGQHIDHLIVDIRRAWPALPLLGSYKIDPHKVSIFGTSIARAVAESMQETGPNAPRTGVRIPVGGDSGSGTAGVLLQTASGSAGTPEIISDQIDHDVRTIVATVPISAGPRRPDGSTAMLAPYARRLPEAIAEQVGTCVPGLGRIAKVEASPVQFEANMMDRPYRVAVTATFTFVGSAFLGIPTA